MSKEPLEYLKHIRDECSYLLSVTGNALSKDEFTQNETLKRAVVRSLEIITQLSGMLLRTKSRNFITRLLK